MKIHVIPNLKKIRTPGTTRSLIGILHEYGCIISMKTSYKAFFGDLPVLFGEEGEMIGGRDLVISIGGDGTILHASKQAIAVDRPVLGINGGTVGFLAEGESGDIPRLAKKLVEGDWRVEERMVLAVGLSGEEGCSLAINDAVLSRGPSSHLIEVDIHCDDRFTDSYRADGIIFATPTGSTAYSLAAGGPIVDPSIDTILLTPICPYTLSARATVFAPSRVIRVTTSGEGEYGLYLSVDGNVPVQVPPGQSVILRQAAQRAKFISFGERLFFEVLSKKITQRGR